MANISLSRAMNTLKVATFMLFRALGRKGSKRMLNAVNSRPKTSAVPDMEQELNECSSLLSEAKCYLV